MSGARPDSPAWSTTPACATAISLIGLRVGLTVMIAWSMAGEERMDLHVVIVYRSLDLVPHAIEWCARRGYVVEGIVPMERYDAALHVIAQGGAQIIVAASKDSLDPHRLPRLEIVDEDSDESGSSE